MAPALRIIPERDLREILLKVRLPGRYVGGEVGAVHKTGDGLLDVAVCYPDLYEVGMSNLAVRILYRELNALEGVRCERVFAVEPDLEAALRAGGIPLYTLESGIPLAGLDLIGFSLGSELTLTNLLQVLDLGGVPLRAADRQEGSPIVLAGGPAATNPAPLGRFVDAVFLGEAEGWLAGAFTELARRKRVGAGRAELLALLAGSPHVWTPAKTGAVKKAVWTGFGKDEGPQPAGAPFPISSIRLVQDEGAVEIMRGCPRGCRFCHATMYYRPHRTKPPVRILREVGNLVHGAGYSEITLASLSSGDYPGLREMVDHLSTSYAPLGISFSLPSLRVSSVDLELMGGLSEVRKSGLTFAVETVRAENQRALNKLVPPAEILTLLLEARQKGWNKAKLYFMVGLPQAVATNESTEIAGLIKSLRARTHMELRVNLGTFVPKPHTTFQDEAMLTEAEAERRIQSIRLSVGRGVRIHWQSPFLSLVEALVSRGDERAAALVEEAYDRGARLDAWHEHHREDIWREVFAAAGWDVEAEITRARDPGEPRPWDGLSLGVTRAWQARERERAASGETTCPCATVCGEPCGACGPQAAVSDSGWGVDETVPARPALSGSPTRFLFTFRKDGKAIYLSHLNMVTVLARAFRRAGLRTSLTRGFNPRPRMELASPLPLGMEADAEVGAVELFDPPEAPQIVERVNAVLPEGVRITGCAPDLSTQPGRKPRPITAQVWGADYVITAPPPGLGEALAGSPQISEVRTSAEGVEFRYREQGVGLPRLIRGRTGRDLLTDGLRVRRLCLLRVTGDGYPVPMGASP